MFKNILVAYDGSEVAQKALETGADLAKQYDAELKVLTVNVITTNLKTQSINSPALAEMLDAAGERVAKQAEGYLVNTGVNYSVEVVNAPSAPKPIIDYVSANDIDLVVIGSRGLGTVRQVFGSVSHAVLNTVTVPVLVIKG